MAQQATNAADLREQMVRETQAKVDEQNKARSGKGTRLRVAQTRGKNPQVITFEQFDTEQKDTLPSSLQEFAELTKVTEEKEILEYAIDGWNQAQYSAASDPIAEYVESGWDKDTILRFRTVVRNYASGAEVPLEDAVALIKP